MLVGGGDEAEQVVGGDAVHGGEAEVVDDDEVVAQQPFDELADGVVGQAAVERFDQLVGGEEADLLAGRGRRRPCSKLCANPTASAPNRSLQEKLTVR